MIIDGHAHACGDYLNSELISRHLDKYGVDMVVLTAGELNSSKTYSMKDITSKKPYADVVNNLKYVIKTVVALTGAAKQIPIGNKYVFNLKKQNSRVKQFYWITKESIAELKENYRGMNFEGVKIHQCWVKRKITSKWFSELTVFLLEEDLPLFIHLDTYKEIEELLLIGQKESRLKIIIGHSFGIERFIREPDKLSPNFYFDISNSYFVSRERIMEAVHKIGAHRLLLGSDTPYGQDSLGLTIQRVRNLPISQEEKDGILGRNLGGLIGLV